PIVHRSCGNRHCPCCRQSKGHAWLARHQARLSIASFLLKRGATPLTSSMNLTDRDGLGLPVTTAAIIVTLSLAPPPRSTRRVTRPFDLDHRMPPGSRRPPLPSS